MRSKRSNTTVALLVIVVWLLWRGTRRQRRLMRLLGALTLGYPGQGAVDAVRGWFGGIGDDIKEFVAAAISVVADALQSGIDWAVTLARNAADVAASLFESAKRYALDLYNAALRYAADVYWAAIDWAQSAVGIVRDLALSLYHTAVDYASDIFNRVVAIAHTLVDAVRDFAVSLYHTAVDYASDIFNRVVAIAHTLVDAVRDLAVSLYHTAVDYASDIFNRVVAIVHTLFDAAKDFAVAVVTAGLTALRDALTSLIGLLRDELLAALGTVEGYVFGTVQAIIDVVSTVLEWLIALAEFPFTTARDIWETMRTTGGRQILDHMPGMVDRWANHVGAFVVGNAAAGDKGFRLAPLPTRNGNGSAGGGAMVGTVGGTGTPDRTGFATLLLAQLGAPPTGANLRFLLAWMGREGTAATFNPLATTLDYGTNTRFNRVGVRNFPDLATGVAATVATLTGDGYDRIVADLVAGDGHAAGQEHAELARWSGGGYDTVAV